MYFPPWHHKVLKKIMTQILSTSISFWNMYNGFNAIYNNISAISWQSVLLEEETGVPGENHQPVTSH
jgi:hypothetical protein